MPAHVKQDGAWKDTKAIFVKHNGAWRQVSTGHIKRDGAWRLFYLYTVVRPVVRKFSSYKDFDAFALFGRPTTVARFHLIIPSGVVLDATSTRQAALDLSMFPAGSSFVIQNDGSIYGRGGWGGPGGPIRDGRSRDGKPGGPALILGGPTVISGSGNIFGGGGGGGGGDGHGGSGGRGEGAGYGDGNRLGGRNAGTGGRWGEPGRAGWSFGGHPTGKGGRAGAAILLNGHKLISNTNTLKGEVRAGRW